MTRTSAASRARRVATPDSLQFYAEHAGASRAAATYTGMSALVARTVFEALTTGLFVDGRSQPVEGVSQEMPMAALRGKMGSVAVMHCAFSGNADTPSPALWQFNRRSMFEHEDPWVFASDCAERLGDVFSGTKFLEEGVRPGSDIYISGPHFMTHDQLIGHIAHQVERTRLPSSDIELASTIAQLGSAVAWAVTGSHGVPRVEFNISEHRFRG